jgi:hypothetical protein
MWQSSVIAVSVVGGVPDLWEWVARNGPYWRQELRWWGQWIRWITRLRRIRRWTPDQACILMRVMMALESPDFAAAQRAVRDTATTLGFNRPEAWIPYSRARKASPRQAENVFRHLRVTTSLPDTLSNPERHLLAELAYHGFADGPEFGITRSPSARRKGVD